MRSRRMAQSLVGVSLGNLLADCFLHPMYHPVIRVAVPLAMALPFWLIHRFGRKQPSKTERIVTGEGFQK